MEAENVYHPMVLDMFFGVCLVEAVAILPVS